MQMKRTTHQVSCQSLLNHGNFSAGFQLNRSIILLFSEPMEKKNCMHSTFAVEQLPIHFLLVSRTEKRNVEKSSIPVSVSDVFFFFFFF